MRRLVTVAIALVGIACVGLASAALGGERSFGSLAASIPAFRLDWGLTPLAAPFLAAVGIVTIAIAMWNVADPKYGWSILAFAATMAIVLLARSVAAFMLAWEAMALASVVLVAAHVEVRRVRRAAFSYLIVSQAGALGILGALAMLAVQAGDPSFAAIAHAAPHLAESWRNWALGLALFGFGAKAGLVPLHFWLPRAHPVAPANGSAMLSGAMLNVAIYGLIVVFFQLAAPAGPWWGVALVVIGGVSAVGGILYAAVEADLKRLLAYSSIEHVGIICVGVGAAVVFARTSPVLAAAALAAALFHAVNHALFKSGLFLAAGRILAAAGTVDLDRLGGLAARMPWTSGSAFVSILAITALPPLNGFASEWFLIAVLASGLDAADAVVRGTAAAGILALLLAGGIAAACFASVYGIAFLGRPRQPSPVEVGRERFGWQAASTTLLALLCIVAGAFPAAVVAPLMRIGVDLLGVRLPGPIAALPALPALPAVALLPIAGALAALVLTRRRSVRWAPTWVCGSLPTARTQYTAAAFTKPLRRIFAFVLFPQNEKRIELGTSAWFPQLIRYRTETAYVLDQLMRSTSARIMRLSRRGRRVQSGNLRLYLAYAAVVLLAIVLVAR